MWQAHPAQRQILPGMRKAPSVVLPPPMSGIEWVVEAFGCSSQSLRDTAVLQDLFNNIIREMKLRPVGETQWHQFPGTGGITGLCLLAESHLACHTFPEHGSLCMILLCSARRVGFRNCSPATLRCAFRYGPPAAAALRIQIQAGRQ